MKTFILGTYSSNEDYDGGCSYATVTIDQQTALKLLARIDALREMKVSDPDTHEMYFWNSPAEYFDYYANEDNFPSEINAVFNSTGLELIELPEGTAVPPRFFERTVLNQTIVRDGAVAFFCYPEYSDVQITTSDLDFDVLQAIAYPGGADATR